MHRVKQIRSYYEKIDPHAEEDYKRLGWESREAHLKRFDILAANVMLENKGILDVGCGLGSLYGYLYDKGINVKYTGVDILESMIDSAAIRYPEGSFLHVDIFKEEIFRKDSFDIIYASGIFNIDLGNNEIFLESALKKFFKLARETVCFNMLHVDSPNREDKYYYARPGDVKKIIDDAASYPVSVRVFESYLKNDFTILCTRL